MKINKKINNSLHVYDARLFLMIILFKNVWYAKIVNNILFKINSQPNNSLQKLLWYFQLIKLVVLI